MRITFVCSIFSYNLVFMHSNPIPLFYRTQSYSWMSSLGGPTNPYSKMVQKWLWNKRLNDPGTCCEVMPWWWILIQASFNEEISFKTNIRILSTFSMKLLLWTYQYVCMQSKHWMFCTQICIPLQLLFNTRVSTFHQTNQNKWTQDCVDLYFYETKCFSFIPEATFW